MQKNATIKLNRIIQSRKSALLTLPEYLYCDTLFFTLCKGKVWTLLLTRGDWVISASPRFRRLLCCVGEPAEEWVAVGLLLSGLLLGGELVTFSWSTGEVVTFAEDIVDAGRFVCMPFSTAVGTVTGNFFSAIDVVLLLFEILTMVESFGGTELWLVATWANVLLLAKEETGKVVVAIATVFWWTDLSTMVKFWKSLPNLFITRL